MKGKLLFLAVVASALFVLLPATAQATMPGPGPHGEQCSVDTFAFYGLDNTIHPGEIGFKTVLGCNSPATLIGHQWLLNANGNGGWNSINETYAQKGKSNVLALTMFSWYHCGAVDSSATNLLQSKASWDMNFNTGFNTYGDHATNHWSKCYFPTLVSFN
jgi:hypothetical protein